MVSIRRLPGERYESEMALVPLESVARTERRFPVEWMSDARNDVRSVYVEWSRPIVGEVPAHPVLGLM